MLTSGAIISPTCDSSRTAPRWRTYSQAGNCGVVRLHSRAPRTYMLDRRATQGQAAHVTRRQILMRPSQNTKAKHAQGVRNSSVASQKASSIAIAHAFKTSIAYLLSTGPGVVAAILLITVCVRRHAWKQRWCQSMEASYT